jgi:hypothetical protein
VSDYHLHFETCLPANRAKARNTRAVMAISPHRLLERLEAWSVPCCNLPSFPGMKSVGAYITGFELATLTLPTTALLPSPKS